ncbi:hypothetical protein [Conexibacter woesei]|uniref:C-type cytochrome biogenesis protein CcmI n=1 Tax=Conexibacter woesei (strain DSM 14684 / CCUG 47730 / CIP 108061 / JCM 11494 / NBRC 100937 / ID131577) TaxID=469383 RepID=D3F7Z6_CONWI|nr:hypothetical protein [Conexibacter woesei]ADB52890.1 hypothetical protein Cwoe_4477 [Conexibacter woesei DSM 14684]
MEFLIVLAVFLAVVVFVAGPLRRGRVAEVERRESAELADLEAAKEAKYREIRDAEMDFRTGKLSEPDYRALDRGLRAEAIQLLRRIDAVKPAASAAAHDAPAAAPPRSDAPVG